MENQGVEMAAACDNHKRRNKRKTRIAAAVIAGTVAAVLLAMLAVNYGAYRKAVSLVENGSYEEAEELFKELKSRDFLDTASYISLCRAHIFYNDNNIPGAYYSMKDVRFSFLTAEKSKAIDEFNAEVKVKYEKDSKEKAEEELRAHQEKIASGVPYVGMLESDIGKTSLGAPSDKVRHNYEIIGGERYVANIYDFKVGKRTVFTVRCVNRWVTEVWDHRNDVTVPYTPKKREKSTRDNDPYNAKDFANEEDFYDENYDNFFSFDDAERYYREHH